MGACCSTIDADVQQQAEVEQDATGGLSDMYEVKHLLGSGSAGDTWLCRDRGSGELLAVKLMKRPIPRVMGANIVREVKIGAQLGRGHLNIVKPKELILTRTHLGIVMEYVAGGNMADYILKTILLKFGSFDTRDGLVMEEDEARYFFTQVINAVDYCHQNKVAHRDLKMDNTLLDDLDPPRIKLCDFGFAKWWTDKPCMNTITGTPDYMSPELLGAKAQKQQQALYDGTKADIWAAGVMLCVMLIGRFPFEGIEMSNATNLEEVSEHVWRQQNSARWYDNPLIAQDCMMLSADCMDLLNKMFNLDSAMRITIPEIRHHPWFDKPLPPPYNVAMADLYAEQRKIDEQVKSGAFVSSDRDAALARMIDAASVRYSPEQEQALLQDPAAAAQPAGGGGAHGLARLSASLMRKISLSSIKPFHSDDVTDVSHVSLNSLSDRFKNTNGTSADGQQQQLQQVAADGSAAGAAVPVAQTDGQHGVQQGMQPLAAVQQQQQQDQQVLQMAVINGVQVQGQQLQQQQLQQQGLQQPVYPQDMQEQELSQYHTQQQAELPMQHLSKQQQQQQFVKQQQLYNSSSSQPPGLASPAGSSSVGQPPGSQEVELAAATSTSAAAAAGMSNNPLRQVSIGEIQVT